MLLIMTFETTYKYVKPSSLRMAIEKWIGDEEVSMIPRGRETHDRIQGHELHVITKPTTVNTTIRVLVYIGSKWIEDPHSDNV